MKIKVFIILLILIAITTFGGAYLEFFQARSVGDNIVIEWKTGDENNVSSYQIERKTLQSSYVSVATIPPKGSNSDYTFTDANAYKTNDAVFIYHLKIVDNNTSVSYSNEISVSNGISGIKKTWGSIKAMFR